LLADDKLARKILERLDRLSQPYGVTVANKDGTGIVTPA
jgi:hypothetical protein